MSDIIGRVKTKLNKDVTSHVVFPGGYTIKRKEREARGEGLAHW